MRRIRGPLYALLTILLAAPGTSAQQGPMQAVSLLGEALHAQAEVTAGSLEALEAARSEPSDPERWMAAGLALAGSWRYQESIDAYSMGLERDPFRALLYRHRGHRFISVRRFAAAAADLELSSRLDPSNWDTWYHLGLARYLMGDFARAEAAYRACLERTGDDGALVAVSDWLWMTLMRQGERQEAAALLEAIDPDMEVGENTAYHQRLLLYKGMREADDLLDLDEADELQTATVGYGIGNWHLVMGRTEQARAIFQRVVAGSYWPAFGFIAAEADLARWEQRVP